MTGHSPVSSANTLRRLRKVFSLGILGNVLTLVSNLLIPPLFIAQLGTDRYGAWLYLFTIPTSLAMFDLGVSAAFSTEVYKLHASSQREAAARAFKTGVKVIGGLMLAVLGVSGALVGAHHASHGGAELHATVALLCAYVLSGFMGELLSSSFKITGQYHRYQTISLVSRLAEIGALLALITTNDFRLMAAAMLALRLGTMALSTMLALRLTPELARGSWSGFVPFKHLVLPSLMYAINPLTMFMALQVPLLVIAPAAGMTALVVYTTVRTLVRLPLQVSNQISMSLYTEFTRLHAAGEQAMAMGLYRKGLAMIGALFLGCTLGGLWLGDTVYGWWLKQVPADFHLIFAVLMCDAVFESCMRHRSSLSSATNHHARDTLVQLVVTSLSVAAMWASSQAHTRLIEVIAPGAVITLLGVAWAVFKPPHRAPPLTP